LPLRAAESVRVPHPASRLRDGGRILINSETAILFTVAASVLSAAAASGAGRPCCSSCWSARGRLPVPEAAGPLTGCCGSGCRPRRCAPWRRFALESRSTARAASSGPAAFGAANACCRADRPGRPAVAEYAFGYASDIRLMELGHTGHPLLRRLMVEAPGTFHHSVVVGTLAERGPCDRSQPGAVPRRRPVPRRGKAGEGPPLLGEPGGDVERPRCLSPASRGPSSCPM